MILNSWNMFACKSTWMSSNSSALLQDCKPKSNLKLAFWPEIFLIQHIDENNLTQPKVNVE